jgi:hypothetical protein
MPLLHNYLHAFLIVAGGYAQNVLPCSKALGQGKQLAISCNFKTSFYICFIVRLLQLNYYIFFDCRL